MMDAAHGADERARGLMVGIAAGNLLGIVQEGWSRRRIADAYPEGVREIAAATGYPDDDDWRAVGFEETLSAVIEAGGDTDTNEHGGDHGYPGDVQHVPEGTIEEHHWSFVESWIRWCQSTAHKLSQRTDFAWRARDVEMAVFSAQRGDLPLPPLAQSVN